ncbi:unnamed protein product [Linum trigynum]|uniref:Uncharacterized protein n=1 Tax=Linum trigynum TaxID=586398 RepID=A0AAV2DAQ0_9ROSI
MEANHATDDQSSPNPVVIMPETAEATAYVPVHTNGVIVKDETQEEEESGAETITDDEQSEDQDFDSSDAASDYTVSSETDEEESYDVDSDNTVPALGEED